MEYLTSCFILCSFSCFEWEDTSCECAIKAKVPQPQVPQVPQPQSLILRFLISHKLFKARFFKAI